MAISGRRSTLAAWVCWAVVVVSSLLLAMSLLMPSSWASGRFALVVGRGQLGVGQASHDLVTAWPREIENPLWQFAGSGMRAQVWSPAPWRPARSDLTMTFAGAPNAVSPVITFGVQWIPLWWPLVIFAAAGIAFTVHARRARLAGQCPHCGYDLRGLEPGTCPECGRPAAPQIAT